MVRQSNGFERISVQRGRGAFRGRGRGAMFFGRGGVQKPPPLMGRPIPPPMGMRRPPMHPFPIGPPPLMRMENPRFLRMFGPGIPRGRGGPGPVQRGRGFRSPFGRVGMIPVGRGDFLPPPMDIPPMFRPHLPGPPIGPPSMMRGRGLARGRGGPSNSGNRKKSERGKVPKKGSMTPPTGELNKPWVTEAMKNEILKKHKLHQKAKKARTKQDWAIFKEHRNKVTTMLREAKLEYIGAHPEEDVDKILAEAASTVSDKGESKEASATSEGLNDPLKLEEGAEPMEDEGGQVNEGMDLLLSISKEEEEKDEQPPQDPELDLKV